jgi:DNA-directed RNA polymerase subunit RPC12/RpoP
LKKANCPSCGASVTFRSTASILAVCEYCRSTLLMKGADLENLGRMADLLPDSTLIRLGTEGHYKGVHFAVVGRIQLKHEAGLWNEWHLLFDDQRSGWLGEGSGEFFLTFQKTGASGVPAFDQFKAGMRVKIGGKDFTVTDIEKAFCVAGEGELPFRVGAGYEAPVVDLQSGSLYLTLDYSESPPLMFLGERVELPGLKLTQLKDESAVQAGAQVAAQALQCAGCGASLPVHSAQTQTVACGQCGSLMDAATREIIAQVNLRLCEPHIPLGTKGRLRGEDYEAIGYQRRRVTVEGIPYEWNEYLLHNPNTGFRWLTEYNGHWNQVKPAGMLPVEGQERGRPIVKSYGRQFRHFQTAQAETVAVLGEFYWRVRIGDKYTVSDFIAPPFILSEESNNNELTWSLSEYVEPEVVQEAFKLKQGLPEKRGVAPNQPSPHEGQQKKYWLLFLLFLGVAYAIQSYFISSGGRVFQQDFSFSPQENVRSFTTDPFRLAGPAPSLLIRNRTDLSNSWVNLNMTLVETTTGQAYHVARDLSQYSGIQGGDGTAGRVDEAVLRNIPPGTYRLTLDAELPPDSAASVRDSLEIMRPLPDWLNFFLAAVGLLSFPLIAWARARAFEARRWEDSDYGTDGTSAADDGDDGGDGGGD